VSQILGTPALDKIGPTNDHASWIIARSILANTYSSGLTAFLPEALARIFSAIVAPISAPIRYCYPAMRQIEKPHGRLKYQQKTKLSKKFYFF
jgi:hypothetical protein